MRTVVWIFGAVRWARSAAAGVLLGLGGQALFALEQVPNFRLPEPAVPTRCADAADAAGRSPTRHRLRVDAEQRGHLARRQQTITSVHNPLLASTSAVVPQAVRRLHAERR